MKKHTTIITIAAFLVAMVFSPIMAKDKSVTIKFIETSDVHGAFFPIDYMTGRDAKGSMARISSYVKSQRTRYGSNLILLENGDILQGQPTNYYWNFIDTKDENIAASIINYLQYDAQTFGNHDVETGHKVFDKWASEINCPVLGANIIDEKTGRPYVAPYTIIERDGVRIAIVGMLTPAIPNWLSKDLYEGLAFEEMVSSSRKWVKTIQETEKPDLMVGLFHAGRTGGIVTPDYAENPVERIAHEVPGFDIIFYGHDHTPFCQLIDNDNSQSSTWIVDPANNARRVGEAEVTFSLKRGKVTGKTINCNLYSVDNEEVDTDYMAFFDEDILHLQAFTRQHIGTFTSAVHSRDCFFGPSALTDLILNLQLQITGADISFNAPLLLNASIEAGEVNMADMFRLYKYENKLYVMRMTGKEILGHLEMSYALWTSQMNSADDHILNFADTQNDGERLGFKNPFFNFDSAAGIIYEVDVTKSEGQKINIISMADGTPFELDKWYKVAVNSYRGNGGGELITRGAGIPKDSIESRIIYRSELDQRYYLMKEIERLGTLDPKPSNNWRFIPAEWAEPALARDRQLLFKQ